MLPGTSWMQSDAIALPCTRECSHVIVLTCTSWMQSDATVLPCTSWMQSDAIVLPCTSWMQCDVILLAYQKDHYSHQSSAMYIIPWAWQIGTKMGPARHSHWYSHGVALTCSEPYIYACQGCKDFSISKDIVKMIVALALKKAKEYFLMLLWLMMMHHHIKFIWSGILSGQTFTAVPNLHCDLDLDLEYSKASFSQNTPVYEHALSNMKQSWSQKDQHFRTYNRKPFHCMKWTQTQLLWPWMWRQQPILRTMTLRLIMVHHDTRFGYKRFSDL